MDLFVKFFDIYNSCKIDYYMTSLGVSLTSMTGAVGLATNVANIFLQSWASDGQSSESSTSSASTGGDTVNSAASRKLDFFQFNNAMATHNPYAVGAFVGNLIYKLIAVEIPTYNT
jgi:hypothetical protein